ncbi:TIGR03084 family metal-binding protein [Nocardia huaxiensis]|uniref:TIGR03084 family protein n=1 Tax=Nocardia huaxiensis TaxID=2755382 RepID=A0A7D6VIU7_9NOCA|nr:TIGR03084 family metal-binding protein [Nocardia huaxiensis]QLY31016.1 TIGR03084 family protein [Nocardia huaxiensis]UFS94536.1 TIGR03084 family metal-binding protein [Nocardia huaxiensis]
MADLEALFADLTAEGDELDRLVADLEPAAWQTDTPAAGWTIAHQIGHLYWTDKVAAIAATEAGEFQKLVEAALPKALTFVDEAAEEAATIPAPELLAAWRTERTALVEALRGVPAGTKLPWFGPPMSVASMATARLMETWAHGQDVADALGVTRTPTPRLRHVAHLGVRTRNFAYMTHGRSAPAEEFRIELTAPDGSLWTWGPEAAAQRITGPALDFCLLVTQRRHIDDLTLAVHGADALEWLGLAQAFAGPPGSGRTAGQFL